jgi:hypothetical protein
MMKWIQFGRPLLRYAWVLGVLASTLHAAQYAPSTPTPAPVKSVFHVKYVSDRTVYLDAGRNAGLEEGMILHLIHADPNDAATDAVRFQGQQPVAEVRIFSVADSTSAAEVTTAREDLVVGDLC